MPHRAFADLNLLCFSHLRWDFVFQRPQHLLTRCARERRVFYIEEPVFEDGIAPRLERHLRGNVTVVVPHLPAGDADTDEMQRALVDEPYGQQGLVRIADDAASFVRACEAAMAEDAAERLTSADAFLRRMSWDGTWNRIDALINETLAAPQASVPSRTAAAG